MKHIKRIAAIAIIAVMVMGLAACGSKRSNKITITNDTSWDMYYVYIAPHEDTSWGDDLLGRNTLAVGDSAEFTLPSANNNMYDICLIDEDGDGWIWGNVEIKGTERGSIQAGPYLTLSDGSSILGNIEYGYGNS